MISTPADEQLDLSSEKDESRFLRKQFMTLTRILPIFLCMLAVVDAFYTVAAWPMFRSAWDFAPPVAYGLLAILRAIHWKSVGHNSESYSISGMRQKIRQALVIGAIMSALTVLSTASLISDWDDERKIAIIGMVLSTTIVATFSLVIVPQIAITVILVVFVPNLWLLASSDNFTLRFTAASAAILGSAQIWMVLRRFRNFRELFESREKLRAAQNRLAAAEQAARAQAHTDYLTGLCNRRTLDAIQAQTETHTERRIAIALIDLDGFKDINDRYGHAAGDILLKLAAVRLYERLRHLGELIRLGGDEFALVCQDETCFPALPNTLNGTLEALKRPFNLAGRLAHVSASSGLCIGEKGEGFQDILSAADRALFEVKRDGKGYNKIARVSAPILDRRTTAKNLSSLSTPLRPRMGH